MAFDATRHRIRRLLAQVVGIAEKSRFGGLAFLANGNMCVGMHGSDLFVRSDPSRIDGALKMLGAHIFNVAGLAANRGQASRVAVHFHTGREEGSSRLGAEVSMTVAGC
ncbi:TfoX/Sxy family protein [Cupriavidus sp. 8B]